MNEGRTEKYLRQMEHIRGHLWDRCSVTVNQVMVATIKLQPNQNQNVELIDYMDVFCASIVIFIHLDVPTDRNDLYHIRSSQCIYVSAVLIIFAFVVVIVSGVFMVVILPILLFIAVSECKV